MLEFSLPQKLTIAGKEYAIRSDFRDVLNLICALEDEKLSDSGKIYSIIRIFYKGVIINEVQEAVDKAMWFLDGGRTKNLAQTYSNGKPRREKKLMDWEQDFPLIIAPINRIAGCDIRGLPFYHWWSFLACYQEIGDCLFSRVVSIRQKKSKGKKLDEDEQRFYNENRSLICFGDNRTSNIITDEYMIEASAALKAFAALGNRRV
jgi:hypothetical protein